MPAQVEEVVVDPGPLHAEQLGEERAQDLLLRRARRPAPAPAVTAGRGSARTSSLPFTVSGSRSTTMIAAGIM
nr:hypothetical protein GCM10020093_070500 [Planobispora longispora]